MGPTLSRNNRKNIMEVQQFQSKMKFNNIDPKNYTFHVKEKMFFYISKELLSLYLLK